VFVGAARPPVPEYAVKTVVPVADPATIFVFTRCTEPDIPQSRSRLISKGIFSRRQTTTKQPWRISRLAYCVDANAQENRKATETLAF
jgi:hypothetical protein